MKFHRGVQDTKRHCVDCGVRLPRHTKLNSLVVASGKFRCRNCQARINGQKTRKKAKLEVIA